jgi:hypothetical protein
MIIVSVTILLFISISSQCQSSNREIKIPPITGEPFEMPRFFKSRNGEHIRILKSPNGKYIAIFKLVGPEWQLFVKTSPKKILDRGISGVNGIQWLTDGNSLIFSVAPIYGRPGVYTWNIKDNILNKIVKPRTFDDAYPDGKDYFEMLSLSEDDDRLFFFYSPDVDKTDFQTFRFKENLYVINVDGTELRKIIQDGKILSGFVFSKD